MEWDTRALGWGVQHRSVMTWAAEDRNADVSAAACAAADDGKNADEAAAAVSTKLDSDCSIRHNRSASEGDATANACSKAEESAADGGRIDHHESASVEEVACASSMAVAVQICPRVTCREGAGAWIDLLVTASECRCAIALHACVT